MALYIVDACETQRSKSPTTDIEIGWRGTVERNRHHHHAHGHRVASQRACERTLPYRAGIRSETFQFTRKRFRWGLPFRGIIKISLRKWTRTFMSTCSSGRPTVFSISIPFCGWDPIHDISTYASYIDGIYFHSCVWMSLFENSAALARDRDWVKWHKYLGSITPWIEVGDSWVEPIASLSGWLTDWLTAWSDYQLVIRILATARHWTWHEAVTFI